MPRLPFLNTDPGAWGLGPGRATRAAEAQDAFVHPSLKPVPQPCASDGRSHPVLQSCPLLVAPAATTSRLGDAPGKVTRCPVPTPGPRPLLAPPLPPRHPAGPTPREPSRLLAARSRGDSRLPCVPEVRALPRPVSRERELSRESRAAGRRPAAHSPPASSVQTPPGRQRSGQAP